MARIISFRVDGLAGRDEPYSVELEEDINVFYGINGSGKTTLLKILHSALSADTSILSNLPFKAAEVKLHLNKFNDTFTRRVDLSQMANRKEQRFKRVPAAIARRRMAQWVSDPPEPDDERLTRWTSAYLPITRLYRAVAPQAVYGPLGSIGGNTMSDEELDSRFAAEIQRIWAEYSADISGRISKVQETGLANILHLVLSGDEPPTEGDAELASGEAYERISSFLGRQPGLEGSVLVTQDDFASKYRRSPEIKSIVKQIDVVEKSIERVTAPRDRLKHLLESMYGGKKRILLSDTEIGVELPNTGKIRLPSLSSGEKQLFFILWAALNAGSNSLMIDEPELSMHVDWQRKLIASLRELNPRMQLIMATHSPEIMADVSDEKVFSM